MHECLGKHSCMSSTFSIAMEPALPALLGSSSLWSRNAIELNKVLVRVWLLPGEVICEARVTKVYRLNQVDAR